MYHYHQDYPKARNYAFKSNIRHPPIAWLFSGLRKSKCIEIGCNIQACASCIILGKRKENSFRTSSVNVNRSIPGHWRHYKVRHETEILRPDTI